MKRELKEENILNYLDYLVQIKIAFGSDRCAEHVNYHGAKAPEILCRNNLKDIENE